MHININTCDDGVNSRFSHPISGHTNQAWPVYKAQRHSQQTINCVRANRVLSSWFSILLSVINSTVLKMKGDACNMSHTPTLKVLVLGEKGVGKTCLIRSLLNENIPEVYEPTEDNWYSTSVQISGKSYSSHNRE